MFKNKNIDFIKTSKTVMIIYAAILVVGITLFAIFGVGLDINFAGGTRFTYTYSGELETNEATKIIESKLDGKKVEVTTSEGLTTDSKKLVVTLASSEAVDAKIQADILKSLKDKFKDNKIELGDSNSVNPTVAGSFFAKSLFAVGIASILVLIYVGFRFKKIGGFSAGLTALIALILDSLIAFITCVIFRLDIDTNFMAVILTILGYSLNDTIVIYDRIRENLRAVPADIDVKPSMAEIINKSVNQTLSRTIMTSATTLLASLALYLLGGSVIHDFAFTITLGVVFGTFSSVFVASPILMAFGNVDLYHQKANKNDDYERPGEHGVV